MKRIIFLTVISLGITAVHAQKLTGKMALNMPVDNTKNLEFYITDASVDIEGYDGANLIIEADAIDNTAIIPPGAEGLQLIKSDRPAEKKPLDYKQIASGTSIIYQLTGSTNCNRIHIMVPNTPNKVTINAKNMSAGAYLSIKNFTGPFEADGVIKTIKISNVSGFFGVKGQGEKVIISNVSWKLDAAGPYAYAISSTGDIDITIPEDMKTTITSFPGPVTGQIYSDINSTRLTTNYPKGGVLQVNGGGVGIFLYNTNRFRGNTYIRKQPKL